MDMKQLCMNLMKADMEEEVIDILNNVGYWGDEKVWRLFGDEEGNYSVAGAQQSKADAALVEKIINSVDARLMDEVLKRGVNPESDDAPQEIRFAVGKYIENHPKPESSHAGRIQFWQDSLRRKVSRDIAVAATGTRSNPSFSIIDRGEGQTPDKVPDTLMSLIRGNKAKIPFVQGKFNMGGTGVFRFCGQHNLQLVITRRDPKIVGLNKLSDDDDCWSFTVVRRDNARKGERSSVFRYLAPVGADMTPEEGGVIRFQSDVLPLFPSQGEAYVEDSEWGTLIKLYEYHAQGFRSHILLPDGLLSRLDMMLPDPALPVRLHECRDFKGKKGSWENTLTGLSVRLGDDKKGNLEDGFPVSCPIKVSGEELSCTIYAFKKGRAAKYKKDEGLVFTYNGQTHAKVNKVFFKGKRVGLGYLANSLLVMLDCSNLSRRAFEDLFMNSRDRLSDDADLTNKIKSEVAYMLKNHEGLRELQNRRKEEEIASQLDDSRPLEEVLEKIFKESPSLASIFLKGTRLSSAFKKEKVKEKNEFKGKQFPSYFHFKNKKSGDTLERDCHINMRCRVQFQTDVENEYFSRVSQHGYFTLERVTNDSVHPVTTFVGPNLNNGFATLTFPLPDECKVGDTCLYRAIVNDETLVEPFVNEFSVQVLSKALKHPGKPGKPQKPASNEIGGALETPSGISLPNSTWVSESDWDKKDPPFTNKTALRIVPLTADNDDQEDDNGLTYDFFINKDNIYLNTELKATKENPKLLEERFRVGMILIGLALIHDESQRKSKKLIDDENVDDDVDEIGSNLDTKVEDTTRAIAPFILPMISSLGGLDFLQEEEAA